MREAIRKFATNALTITHRELTHCSLKLVITCHVQSEAEITNGPMT